MKLVRNEKNDIIYILLFFIVTLIVYFKSLYGSFIFDDLIVILREPLLKTNNFFDFLKELPFKERPVRLLTFYIDKYIWGFNPFGYRFTNLILHFLNGVLLFYLLKSLKFKEEVAFFSVCLFLWHFANPATVCYITGRKDLLGFFFAMTSFFCLKKWTQDKCKKWLAFFIIFYSLAFFTKEMYITIPFIAIAYAYFVKDVKPRFLWIVLSFVLVMALTFYVVKFRDVHLGNFYRRFSIPEFFLGYIRLFFDPTFPKVDYVGYFNEAYTLNQINWKVFVFSSFLMLLYIYFAWFLRKKNKITSFLLWAFLISLLPVLQIIEHSESFAEHYFYFPSMFMSVFVVYEIFKISSKKMAILLFSLIFIFLLPYTYKRTSIFMTKDKFWLEAYKKNPKSFRAKQQYGQKLLFDGKLEEALKIFEEGLKETEKLYNYSDLAYTYYYDFLNDLALYYIAKDDLKKAEKFYLKGLETLPESDKKELFLSNLARIYLKQDRKKGKIFVKQLYFRYDSYKELAYLLYDSYWQDGNIKELEIFIDDVLQKKPHSYFAIAKKTLLYLKRDDKNNALKLYDRLKKLSPSSYYELNDIAEIEIYLGNYDKALKYLLMALKEKPEYGRTKKNLIRLDEIMKKS